MVVLSESRDGCVSASFAVTCRDCGMSAGGQQQASHSLGSCSKNRTFNCVQHTWTPSLYHATQ
jgi:hypothetical protein